MNKGFESDGIDLKKLIKKIIDIVRVKKVSFLVLLMIIMSISSYFFINELVSPVYKSDVLIKSRFVKKDQLQNIIESYNASILDESLTTVPDSVHKAIVDLKIKNIELIEIKPELNSPDKNDGIKMYRLISIYKSKPEHLDKFNIIIRNIQEIASADNEIIASKAITLSSIAEIDSLLSVASEAGYAFRNKMNMPGNLMIMNDLYKSLNEILQRKSDLQSKLASLQTKNIIYVSSSWIIAKSMKVPVLFFFIGLSVWGGICLGWIVYLLLLNDNE